MLKILKKTFLLKDQYQEDIDLLDFKKLYLEHESYIRNLIFWMVRDDSVDDLVQETFLKAWNKISDFNGSASFKTWVHRIAINTTHDYFRKNRKNKVEVIYEQYREEFDTKELITYSLKKMSVELREVFVMYYKFGYTSKEIAKILDRPEGTIKFKIMEAKNIFKEVYLQESQPYER